MDKTNQDKSMQKPSEKAPVAGQVTSMKGIPPGFEVLHRCGEGTFGQVFLCKDPSGNHVAVKTIKQEGAKQESEGVPLATIREASLLKELQHPNILQLESVFVKSAAEEMTLSLVFEFVDHDLHEMMQVQKGYTNRSKQLPVEYFPSDMVCSIMHQIISGLEYLHTNWIIHRDMKPSNILVSGIASPDPGRVRIADFGLARVYRSPPRALSENGVVVTIWYRAPELLLGTAHYTPAVDMWAAGCIFGELLTLNAMFPGSEVREPLDAFQHDQLHRIMSIMGPFSEADWPEINCTLHWKRNTQQIRTPHREYQQCLEAHLLRCNPTLTRDSRFKNAVDLIKQLLQYNPGKRLTAQEALKHPYFQQQSLPVNACYPPGYKPRYNSKAVREQQKKKPAAVAASKPAASRVAVSKPGAENPPVGKMGAGKAAAGKAAGQAGTSGGSRQFASSAAQKGSGSGQGKGRQTSKTSAVNRVEKKGAHVRKKSGKADK